ncbi:hypothetical protein CRU93_08905 [Arcobacter sp. CECT 8985]|nr:hypothetical protein CRU93_08905 [Arcobacter sp. CECT 8985]
MSTTANTSKSSFSSVLADATTVETPVVKQADFTSMTRKEMFDWMNEQICNGKLSLDDSSTFLGMTMKISVISGHPVDMNTDDTRINFIEKARLGVENALSRNDLNLAARLQVAIEIMNRHKG